MIFSSTSTNNMAENANTNKKHHQQQIIPVVAVEGDGSSIEIAKRPRGRPPGSKNKPKPPVIITREAEPSAAMRPHILEIPSGHDVIDSLLKFSRRKNLGICVLAGNGFVSNVTLRQPPHPAEADGTATTVGLHGRLEILSLSATVMPPSVSAVFSLGVGITLAGPQGQVIGGAVVGPLMSAGTVTVVAAAFDNPTFHRLPVAGEDEVAKSVSVSASGGEDESSGHQKQKQELEAEEQNHHHQQQQQQHYVHREYQHHHHFQQQAAAAESCGMAIYSSHFPAEVIWAPAARPLHPPPY